MFQQTKIPFHPNVSGAYNKPCKNAPDFYVDVNLSSYAVHVC